MTLWRDIVLAARTLRRNPGFTLIAVLTLALGIGANAAIFSVVNGVLLRPLSFPEPERIVTLQTRWSDTGRLVPRVTGGDWLDLRDADAIFEAASVHYGGEIGVQLGDKAEFTGTHFVNPGFFQVFAMPMAAGRAFGASEAKEAAVVSAAFAQRNFGSPSTALGRTVGVENRAYEIVGVAAAGAVYPPKAEVWLAAPNDPKNVSRTAFNYRAVARLKPGVDPQRADAQLKTLAAGLAAAHPQSNARKEFVAVPLQDALTKPARATLLILLGAVALVLLIACANVANLLLARGAARAREMALRTALGAGSRQLVRQLMTESVLLALAGGFLGVLLARAGLDALLLLAPANLPRLNEVTVDLPVLLFTILASLAASVLFGLAPAWQASRTDLNDCLKQGGVRGLIGGGGRLKSALIVAEIALSVVLVTAGGLLFRSFMELNRADLGFRTESLLVMESHQPADGLKQAIAATQDFERLTAELRTLPGVVSSAAAMGLPMGRYGSNGGYTVEGSEAPRNLDLLPQAGFRLASPGYFETMGIPLKQGRDFREQDQYESEFVAVINESLARQSFKGQDPIGRRIICGLDSPKAMTIVGVAGDTRQDSPGAPPAPELYMPLKQHPFHANEVQVIVRTVVPPESLQSAIVQAVRQRYPDMATKFTTMEAMYSDSVAAPRFRMLLVSAFGVLALLLAMAGVYGVVSYLVSQRAPELGLRMALGADRSSILRMVVGQSLRLGLTGLLLGAALSVASGRFLETMLFGLSTTDAATYAGTAFAVLAVTGLAALAPAWRASRVDPLEALRQE